MTLSIWLGYVLTCAVVVALPGPTILAVVSTTLSEGRRAFWPLIAAVTLGDLLAVSVSLLGLGALLAMSATLFSLFKFVGGGYLIWLGVKTLRAGFSLSEAQVGADEVNLATKKIFTQTFLITALNPKGMIFFVAFLPQFVSAGAPVVPQLAVLAMTFVVMGALNAALYALFANQIRAWLQRGRGPRLLSLGCGGGLCGAGFWALAARHPSAS